MKKNNMKSFRWVFLLAGLVMLMPLTASAQGYTGLEPPLWCQEESPYSITITLNLQQLMISGDTADQLFSRLENFLTGEREGRSIVREALQEELEGTVAGGRQSIRRLLTLDEMDAVLHRGFMVLAENPAVHVREAPDTFIPLTQWLDQWESADEEKPWNTAGSWEVTLVNVERKNDLTYQRQITVGDPNCLRQLVNRQWVLPEDYAPTDLVIPQVPRVFPGNAESGYMRQEAAEALERLFEAALEETGVTLYARSGYRSYATQRSLFNSRARERGFERANRTTALPGQSEHQTGLAMDITSYAVRLQLSTFFGKTPEGQWVDENAHRFGYIVRYPEGKSDVTGYIHEPWHIRYVGIPLAKTLFELQLTMEEYLDERKGRPLP